MNNSQIGAAFAAMCNGTKKVKSIIGRGNLHVYPRSNGEGVALYSYSTPIAVYDGEKVVINDTFFSNATARHQGKIRRRRRSAFTCPVAVVLHFGGLTITESELLWQAAPLYGYERRVFEAANGSKYTRFVLLKQTQYDGVVEIHRYVKEQAAKDEAARLNNLAYGWSNLR